MNTTIKLKDTDKILTTPKSYGIPIREKSDPNNIRIMWVDIKEINFHILSKEISIKTELYETKYKELFE